MSEHEQSQEQQDKQQSEQGDQMRVAISAILQEGREVQERVQALLVKTIEERSIPFRELEVLVGDLVEACLEGVKSLAPDMQQERLQMAFGGLEDALKASLYSASKAIEEAKGRGEKFAEEELKDTVNDLETLDKLLAETLAKVFSRGGEELAETVQTLQQHGRRIAEGVKPAITETLSALKESPIDSGRELTGKFAEALAGVLQKAADNLKKDAD